MIRRSCRIRIAPTQGAARGCPDGHGVVMPPGRVPAGTGMLYRFSGTGRSNDRKDGGPDNMCHNDSPTSRAAAAEAIRAWRRKRIGLTVPLACMSVVASEVEAGQTLARLLIRELPIWRCNVRLAAGFPRSVLRWLQATRGWVWGGERSCRPLQSGRRSVSRTPTRSCRARSSANTHSPRYHR